MTTMFLVGLGLGVLFGCALAAVVLMPRAKQWTIVHRMPKSTYRSIERAARRKYWSPSQEIRHRLENGKGD